MSSASDRYAGRPLLRLLDEYVLDVVGAGSNSDPDARLLLLRRAFPGVAGNTWQEILETELQLEPGMRASIAKLWDDYQAFMKAKGQTVDASEFTRSVVDENFLPLINKL